MAIVEMSKLTIIGIRSQKQKLLDSLFSSKLVELKQVKALPNTSKLFNQNKFDSLDMYCSKLERAIQTIEENLPLNTKLENVFDVSVENFKKLEDSKPQVESILHELDIMQNQINENKKEKANLENKLNQLLPYSEVKENFSCFKNTKYTTILLGIISPSNVKELIDFLKNYKLTIYEVLGADNNILKLYSHNSESSIVIKKLNELGFSKCNLNLQTNAREEIKQIENQINLLNKSNEEIKSKYKNYIPFLKEIKIMRDYIKFCMEKEDSENKINSTKQSFVLECFLAKENEEKLKKILDNLNLSIEYEFSKPNKNEVPPTITKNNKIVSQFEFVTNMYSSPNYNELDPNFFIALFFSLFFGFIMADVGYGLILTLGGLILAKKQTRPTGLKKLMNVLSIGGVTSIVFGVLFGSFFGVELPCFMLQDNAKRIIEFITLDLLIIGVIQLLLALVFKIIGLSNKNKVKFSQKVNNKILSAFSLVGLVFIMLSIILGAFFGAIIPVKVLPNPINNVITMLVACLGAGVVQIMVSFILKGVLLVKRGKIFEAIFSAFSWDFFFVGLTLFLLEFANIYVGLKNVGLIIAISSVGISVVGLAIINKGFERVSKSFGSVYGIINLFSDILSYARLFGLMLSGAIIASIVNQLAANFLLSPVTFAVGAIILFIGHAFNLAMGALGAYIHVARLQYIEFFSRFYEGEGELFVPFGQTNFHYVNLIN